MQKEAPHACYVCMCQPSRTWRGFVRQHGQLETAREEEEGKENFRRMEIVRFTDGQEGLVDYCRRPIACFCAYMLRYVPAF